MSQMNNLATMIDELRSSGELLLDIAANLERMFSATAATSEPVQPSTPVFTLEQVRAVLADKARQGYTAQIRELLQSHGADKLSDIDPKDYPALLEEVEVLENE